MVELSKTLGLTFLDIYGLCLGVKVYQPFWTFEKYTSKDRWNKREKQMLEGIINRNGKEKDDLRWIKKEDLSLPKRKGRLIFVF